jgi:U5 small nuclear ribonucleoprotein component
MDLYDEFGNYVGPELQDEEEQVDAGLGGGDEWAEREENEEMMDGSAAIIAHGTAAAGASTAVVLLEDKKFYPDADEVYPDAETMVQDEDTQPLSQPIVAPVKVKLFSVLEGEPPTTAYAPEFVTALMGTPSLIRNLTVMGHLHHGKTSLLDSLIERTHAEAWASDVQRRYTDSRVDEQARGVSIKAAPVTLLLQDGRDKSYMLNLLDTPGHVNFSDEVTAGLRISDGALLVVDAVEGVMLNTERLVRHACGARLPLVLVIAKVDRLLLELKLPPTDAYFKLLHVIAEVNALVALHGGQGAVQLHPAAGNVVFSAAVHGWSFTLQSWAAMHLAKTAAAAGEGPPGGVRAVETEESAAFARRLWGDNWLDPPTRKLVSKAPSPGAPRSFISFVLQPLYKVYAAALGEEPGTLAQTLAELGVRMKHAELTVDARPLLKTVLSRWLGDHKGLVGAVVAHVPNPAAAAAARVPLIYTGSSASVEAGAMRACDPRGPLMVNVTKLLPTPDGTSFLALGRVWSGCLAVGDRVRVLGEGYSADDGEDSATAVVTGLAVGQARYRTEVTLAPAGNWVLIEGVSDVIAKTATLAAAGPDALPDVAVFRPLQFNTVACVNVSVEPLNPSELPKVLAGLRAVTKAYPLARTRVEESGEHVLIGTGELALDCMLHDLREMFARVEVKVADPVVSFQETVSEQSSAQAFALTPNKKNKLSMLAEPLDRGACPRPHAHAPTERSLTFEPPPFPLPPGRPCGGA